MRWPLLLALLVATTSCAPASERPLRGAVPGAAAATAGLPPTLTASEALRQRELPTPSPAAVQPSPGLSPQPGPSPSASPNPVANPAASPSPVAQQPPIVRTIVPGANGQVPAGGPVTLSAVLVGRTADLASASLLVNGADAGAQIDKRSPRDWTIHTSKSLGVGTHTVRVLVTDSNGTPGGFTWQFVVGQPQPSPSTTP